MDNLQQLLKENLNIDFIAATLSDPRTKDGTRKIKVRPILTKGTLFFQLELFENTQVFHKNLLPEETGPELCRYLEIMRQMQIRTKQYSYSVLISKKGKATVKKKVMPLPADQDVELSHNRSKQYLLKEGIYVPFLGDLGVMTPEGKVIRSKYDKFRQINRFLEFIEDILPRLDKERELTILDFGCGKSYLTFAVFYYLHVLNGYRIKMIGLDLKEEVIRHCNDLARSYGYEKLTFLAGNIADYSGSDKVDMVVTLHACDTATDYALAKAVEWEAQVILSVPCCQHELNGQIQNDIWSPVFKYGLIKERIAALVTDAMRAGYLEAAGYDTQILEFIDIEHTPKNILIRAVKAKAAAPDGIRTALQRCEDTLHVSPTLGRLLEQERDLSDEKKTD